MKELIAALLLAGAAAVHADDLCGPNGPRTMQDNPFAQQFCAADRMGGVRSQPMDAPLPPDTEEVRLPTYAAVFGACFVFGGCLGGILTLRKRKRRQAPVQHIEADGVSDVVFTERNALTNARIL